MRARAPAGPQRSNRLGPARAGRSSLTRTTTRRLCWGIWMDGVCVCGPFCGCGGKEGPVARASRLRPLCRRELTRRCCLQRGWVSSRSLPPPAQRSYGTERKGRLQVPYSGCMLSRVRFRFLPYADDQRSGSTTNADKDSLIEDRLSSAVVGCCLHLGFLCQGRIPILFLLCCFAPVGRKFYSNRWQRIFNFIF